LAGQGIDVEVHTIGAAPAAVSPRVVYRAAPGAVPRRLGRSPILRKSLLASSADLLHAHCLWMLPLRYAAAAARKKEVPLIISPRGMLAPWSLRRSRFKKALAARLVHPDAFRAAAAWHATSEQEADDIRALGHRQPIYVVPNGVRSDVDADGAVSYYRGQAPAIEGRRVLLFYSRFHEKKRVLELLADFAAIARARPEWHLLAVGIPEQYSLARLQAEARKLGLSERVTILDGLDAPKPYAVAELLALPTHDENFGQVVAEALCAGVPVITTTGTPWHAINALGAGRCVGLDEFRAELDALMAQPPSALREAGARGRSWARATLDWPAIGAQMATAYHEILGRWSVRP
jgi:glycosyltransferase involved in cell wall biosynthesis